MSPYINLFLLFISTIVPEGVNMTLLHPILNEPTQANSLQNWILGSDKVQDIFLQNWIVQQDATHPSIYISLHISLQEMISRWHHSLHRNDWNNSRKFSAYLHRKKWCGYLLESHCCNLGLQLSVKAVTCGQTVILSRHVSSVAKSCCFVGFLIRAQIWLKFLTIQVFFFFL